MAGPLRSADIAPLHRYYGPLRHPLAFGRLPGVAGYTASLAPAISRRGKQRLVALVAMITDIHSLGLESAQGLLLTEAFYWDMNEQTRAWSRRFFERMKRMPTMLQAGAYSSTLHYLRAVQAAGTAETGAVMAQMRRMPVQDFFAPGGRIREDGLMVHDMYLFQVKSPEESKEPWDYYKLVATIPGDQAFQPLSESKCPLVAKAQ